MKTLLISAVILVATCAGAFAQSHNHDPLTAHLSFKNRTLHLHAKFLKTPEVGTDSALRIEAHEAVHHDLVELNDLLEVELWMPSMGHGSAPTQIERQVSPQGEIEPGIYLVKNVYFVMPGKWQVRVQLTSADGKTEVKSFDLTISGSDHNSNHNH